jgi:hypothetical protein
MSQKVVIAMFACDEERIVTEFEEEVEGRSESDEVCKCTRNSRGIQLGRR